MAPPLVPIPTKQLELLAIDPSDHERTHVHAVYDLIAHNFHSTRHTPWPVVLNFLNAIPPGSLGLDAGCGNGKYLPRCPNGVRMIGLDRSVALLEHARLQRSSKELKQNFKQEIVISDVLYPCIREQSMDFAISIATIHHLSTHSRRRDAICNLLRAVHKNGGRILLYVWALEQSSETSRRVVPIDEQTGQPVKDVMVPWVLEGSKAVSSNRKLPKKIIERNVQQLHGTGQTCIEPQNTSCKNSNHIDQAQGCSENQSHDAFEREHGDAEPISTTCNSTSEGLSEVSGTASHQSEREVHNRYYHLFAKGDLEALAQEAIDLVVNEEKEHNTIEFSHSWQLFNAGYDRDNWWLELRGMPVAGLKPAHSFVQPGKPESQLKESTRTLNI